MWDVVENEPVKIEKVNTIPLAPCAGQSIVRSQEEEENLGQNEEEAPCPPPRSIRVPKPYEEWTKEDHILARLDNNAKNGIMKILDKVIFGKVKGHTTTPK